MTILETNETGETVADLSPEPKKRKGRPQPEDQKPTDPNIPPIGTDIWLCEGGVWSTKPRKVDKHGVTSDGDAFQVAGYSMWLLLKHLGEYWLDFSPEGRLGDTVKHVDHNSVALEEVKDGDAIATTAFPTGEISRNPEERTPIPGTEEPAEPSKKLECAISRHKHLTPDLERFLTRLLTWEMPVGWGHIAESAEAVMAGMENLGSRLLAAQVAGAYPKVTARSRLRSWLRPGAPVALRDDIAGIYAQMYSQEELASLEVMAVLETKVALRERGGRELGLVELAHVRRP